MRLFILLPLGFAALYDGFATFLGIAVIIKAQNAIDYALGAVGASVILGISLSTPLIWESRKGNTFVILRIPWVAAVFFDFYTTYMANLAYVIGKMDTGKIMELKVKEILGIGHDIEMSRYCMILFLTLVVSGAPIIFSVLLGDDAGPGPVAPAKSDAKS